METLSQPQTPTLIPVESLREWATRYAMKSAFSSLAVIWLLFCAIALNDDGELNPIWVLIIGLVVYLFGSLPALLIAVVAAHVLVSIPPLARRSGALRFVFAVVAILLGNGVQIFFVVSVFIREGDPIADWVLILAAGLANVFAAYRVSRRIGPPPMRPW